MLALMEVNKQMKRNAEFLLFQGSKAFHEVSAVVSAGYLKKQKKRKKGSLNMLLVGLGENTCKPRSEPSLTLLFSIQKADQTEAWKLSLYEEVFSKPANSQYFSNDSSLNKANAILLS